VLSFLTPPKIQDKEILDDPHVDPYLVTRSLADVARANFVFGGLRSAIKELTNALGQVPREATLLDVGTGLGDIPRAARDVASARGIQLTTVGLDSALELARASRGAVTASVCGDALRLPFADHSVDIVMCSQVLHHFSGADALKLLREMNRVARVRVVVSDIRRSWIAAAGLWVASFPLRFHAVSRHDGVVSVLRGFTPEELRDTVRQAVARTPVVHRRWGFRVTTSWTPVDR
jgi:ubiquinone/menaquinone biosynthesis C-methylase UbiE